jgi:hypothetical protein
MDRFFELLIAKTEYHAVTVWGADEDEALENFLDNEWILVPHFSEDCPPSETKVLLVKPLDNTEHSE